MHPAIGDNTAQFDVLHANQYLLAALPWAAGKHTQKAVQQSYTPPIHNASTASPTPTTHTHTDLPMPGCPDTM